MGMAGYVRKVRSLDWIAKPSYLVSSASECIAWPFSGSRPMGKTPLELGYKGRQLIATVAAHHGRARCLLRGLILAGRREHIVPV